MCIARVEATLSTQDSAAMHRYPKTPRPTCCAGSKIACIHAGCWNLRLHISGVECDTESRATAQSRPEKGCTRDLQRQLLKPGFRLLRILAV